MKPNLLIGLLALLLTVAGIFGFFRLSPASLTDVAVTVNGTPITEAQIQQRIQYHSLRNQAFETVLEYSSDKEALLQKALGPTHRKGAKEELIKGQVIRDALSAYDGPFSYEQTAKAADSQWETLTTDDGQASFYLALKEAMEQQGVTQEEFQQYSRDYAYDFYNASRLEQAYAQQGQTTSQEQFSAYVDHLLAGAEIVYP